MPYERFELWKSAFHDRQGDEASCHLATLYAQSWRRGCAVAKRIASDAHGLTLHDEAHFSSLWKCASMVAGGQIKLAPIEAFILGVAILIHDAAHTVIAYHGGLAAIEATPEWQDALSARLPPDAVAPLPEASALAESVRREVVFDAVRALHAHQAIKLVEMPFRHPAFDAEFYIVEDPGIRHHFGELIGKVAASHHWNLSKIEALGRTVNAVSPYGDFGPIRPMLLAALLRTADAIQIDSARAPDFELALTAPTGVSLDHWKAQNRIATGIDEFDDAALVVNSSRSFDDQDIGAWWVAYDLARNADKELREIDSFLQDHRQDRFSLKRVKDISTPALFAEHVRPNGWVPINAELKVTETAKLIEVFGGRELYGDNDVVPLRELIQNAADAVRARRLIDTDYSGRIVVSLIEEADANGTPCKWLKVSDDGIGMSLPVLTGPFLTFGETGWASNLMKSERPGFMGKRFRPIGRYGIGFFSVFMIGKEVKVATKPFDQGPDGFRTLHFREGLGVRPLVKPGGSIPDSYSMNTTVQVAVDAAWIRKVLRRTPPMTVYEVGKPAVRKPAEKYTLQQLVEVICPAIDVQIDTFDVRTDARGLIMSTWESGDASDWLKRIRGGDGLPAIVEDNLDLLELVDVGGRPVGRMMISPLTKSHGITGVGGFADKPQPGVETVTHFEGYLSTEPSGPHRRAGRGLDKAQRAAWATGQVAKWALKSLDGAARNAVAANASQYGGDPILLANAKIDGNWHSLDQIFDLLEDGVELTAPLRPESASGPWSIMGSVNEYSGRLYDVEDMDIQVGNLLLAGETAGQTKYWQLPTPEDPAPSSFISALDRHCLSRGRTLGISTDYFDFGRYIGPTIKRERKTSGDRLRLPGVKLRFVPGGPPEA